MADSGTEVKRRRRLTDEERKVLWHKAVMAKARQMKSFADGGVYLMLALVCLAHVFTFVRVKTGAEEEWRRRGCEIVLGLLVPRGAPEEGRRTEAAGGEDGRFPADPTFSWGVHPRILYARGADGRLLNRVDRSGKVLGKARKFRPDYPAGMWASLYLVIPVGLVVILVLYILDYFLWMGRILPLVSAVYGFGSVVYLMITKTPLDGVWNAMQSMSAVGWYLMLVPLFLTGTISMLRLTVSQRWKRYEFAGLEVPEHLKPQKPEESGEEKKGKEEKKPQAEGQTGAGGEKAGGGETEKPL